MAVWNTSFSPYQLPGYTYPQWSVWLGWFIRMTSVSSIPIYIIYKFITTPGSFKQVCFLFFDVVSTNIE